jgi:hypothetical protein
MRRVLFAAAMLASLAFCPAAFAASRTDCHAQATRDLQRLSPQGHAIYLAMTDKKLFFTWVGCEDVQLGLATAVHESVHILTEKHDAFPLLDGGLVRRPHEASKFFPPKETAGRFDKADIYVQTYLRPGAASSADDFLYLLDELNAYSHDLNSAVKLAPMHRPVSGEVAHRDGLAALMSFVMSYVDVARQQKPPTWAGLQRSEPSKVLRTLWTQAETVLASSCALPAFGRNDGAYIGFMCKPENAGALAELLGRAPACPRECLSAGTAALR